MMFVLVIVLAAVFRDVVGESESACCPPCSVGQITGRGVNGADFSLSLTVIQELQILRNFPLLFTPIESLPVNPQEQTGTCPTSWDSSFIYTSYDQDGNSVMVVQLENRGLVQWIPQLYDCENEETNCYGASVPMKALYVVEWSGEFR